MGGYVDRLRAKLRTTGSGFPIGEAENNSAFSTQITKLFGPIEIWAD
jgi:hypothetical protein